MNHCSANPLGSLSVISQRCLRHHWEGFTPPVAWTHLTFLLQSAGRYSTMLGSVPHNDRGRFPHERVALHQEANLGEMIGAVINEQHSGQGHLLCSLTSCLRWSVIHRNRVHVVVKKKSGWETGLNFKLRPGVDLRKEPTILWGTSIFTPVINMFYLQDCLQNCF